MLFIIPLCNFKIKCFIQNIILKSCDWSFDHVTIKKRILYHPKMLKRFNNSFWTSFCSGNLSVSKHLLCNFCSSDRGFASNFFQTPPHDGCPCLWLTVPTAKPLADFHRQVITHAEHTSKNSRRVIPTAVSVIYLLFSFSSFFQFYNNKFCWDSLLTTPLLYTKPRCIACFHLSFPFLNSDLLIYSLYSVPICLNLFVFLIDFKLVQSNL